MKIFQKILSRKSSLLATFMIMFSAASVADDVKPIRDLSGVDALVLAKSDKVTAEQLLAFGVVIDGQHYQGACTAGGACAQKLLNSRSIAKSVVAGTALMRLQKLYGDARTALLVDYVPTCKGWDGVTFEHLLNMVSGHYENGGTYDDENAHFDRFYAQMTAKDMVHYACSNFTKQAKPGTHFVYRTSDTFLLSVAMQRYYRSKTGNHHADFYRDLLVPLWQDLGLSSHMMESGRTNDSDPQVFAGWGQLMLASDIAAIATAFATDDERLVANLDSSMVAEALQQQEKPNAIAAGAPDFHYAHGFWARRAFAALNCAGDIWLPFMSGWGGKQVLMLPSGDVYYSFTVSHNYEFKAPILALDAAYPVCEKRK